MGLRNESRSTGVRLALPVKTFLFGLALFPLKGVKEVRPGWAGSFRYFPGQVTFGNERIRIRSVPGGGEHPRFPGSNPGRSTTITRKGVNPRECAERCR